MPYCPRDNKPCNDDFCQTGTCFLSGDIEVLKWCWKCKQLYSSDIPCDCDPYEDDE